MLTKAFVEVHGAQMAYTDVGDGDPLLLLHGNPMHGFLWHALVPHIETLGRIVIPDLIGMGDSERLTAEDPHRYSFSTHRRYLDAFLEAVGVSDRVVVVCHDWGGALGFDWARRHSTKVKGIVYFETHVNTSNVAATPGLPEFVRFLRSADGEESVLHGDVLFDFFLSSRGFGVPLDRATKAEILRPWTEPGENRRAMLSWIQQAPIDGEPADVYDAINSYTSWLRASPVPKLLITASDGFVAGSLLDECRQWPEQTEAHVRGAHFVQIDSPADVGRSIRHWHRRLDRM
ncbi:haloalkane dehalogenase [Mycobacterium sp. NPDC003449]